MLKKSMQLQREQDYGKYELRKMAGRGDGCCSYIAWVFRSGGFVGSVFSLIAATLGTGVISFAYAIMKNGYVLGPIYVVLGALLSFYSGVLIIKTVESTGLNRLEDIALQAYGRGTSIFVSICNIICLIGFVFSYITFVKNELCEIVNQYAADDAHFMRKYFSNHKTLEGEQGIGDYVWGCIYTYIILFPMSLPRDLNSLRFSSTFGVICSMYLSVAVMSLFLTGFKEHPEMIPSK
jgi:amino acid permease